jgi:1-deoxy-D-xylulose-5-phosphate reductoisomerase
VREVVILGSTGQLERRRWRSLPSTLVGSGWWVWAAGGSQVALLARQVMDSGAQTVAVSRATSVQDLQLALYAEASRRGWAEGKVQLPRILAGPQAACRAWRRCRATSY